MKESNKSLKGVNLGGWLVLERWMTPSIFGGTEAIDEKSLSQTGETARQKIKKHHAEFINEDDFIWIKDHGLDAVRIPIGYWIFGGEPPFVGSIDRLDFAFKMAEKYDLKILLDIHAAAGSQNGKRHSGEEGEINWYKNRHKTLQVTAKLAERYATSPALWGIELLNEPKVTTLSVTRLLRYYRQATRLIRLHCNQKIKIIIGGDTWSGFWAGRAKSLGAALDLHYYHSFGKKNRLKSSELWQVKAVRAANHIHKLQLKSPVIVGEWSVVLGSGVSRQATEQEKNELMRDYAALQIKSYESADAWFYWSYKTESSGSWNFRWLAERNIIDI